MFVAWPPGPHPCGAPDDPLEVGGFAGRCRDPRPPTGVCGVGVARRDSSCLSVLLVGGALRMNTRPKTPAESTERGLDPMASHRGRMHACIRHSEWRSDSRGLPGCVSMKQDPIASGGNADDSRL